MIIRSKFLSALKHSAITSLLMLIDRLVLNIIPVMFWGPTLAATWIGLRGAAFVLMCLEGGRCGRLSKLISSSCFGNKNQVLDIIKEENVKLTKWWFFIFIGTLSILGTIYLHDLELFYVGVEEYFLVYIVTLFYVLFYYNSQLLVYALRGLNYTSKAQLFVNKIKLIEILLLLILPFMGFEALVCILSMCFTRALGVLYGWKILNKLLDEKVEFLPSNSSDLPPLGVKMWVGYFLYPLYPAVNSFLPILLLSISVKPSALILFSISRLFGRILSQFSQVLSRVLWPELLHINKKERKEFGIKVIKRFLYSNAIIFSLILPVIYFLDGKYFKEVEFSFSVSFWLLLISFFASVTDVILSILIVEEEHFSILLARFLLLLTIIPLSSFVVLTVMNTVFFLFIMEVLVLLLAMIKYKRVC